MYLRAAHPKPNSTVRNSESERIRRHVLQVMNERGRTCRQSFPVFSFYYPYYARDSSKKVSHPSMQAVEDAVASVLACKVSAGSEAIADAPQIDLRRPFFFGHSAAATIL